MVRAGIKSHILCPVITRSAAHTNLPVPACVSISTRTVPVLPDSKRIRVRSPSPFILMAVFVSRLDSSARQSVEIWNAVLRAVCPEGPTPTSHYMTDPADTRLTLTWLSPFCCWGCLEPWHLGTNPPAQMKLVLPSRIASQLACCAILEMGPVKKC